MATIRKRGNKYQVMIRKKNVNNSKTFQRMSDAKRWAEETELSIERNEAGLPHSSKDSLFRDLIKSYKSRAIRSNRSLGKSKENILIYDQIKFAKPCEDYDDSDPITIEHLEQLIKDLE